MSSTARPRRRWPAWKSRSPITVSRRTCMRSCTRPATVRSPGPAAASPRRRARTASSRPTAPASTAARGRSRRRTPPSSRNSSSCRRRRRRCPASCVMQRRIRRWQASTYTTWSSASAPGARSATPGPMPTVATPSSPARIWAKRIGSAPAASRRATRSSVSITATRATRIPGSPLSSSTPATRARTSISTFPPAGASVASCVTGTPVAPQPTPAQRSSSSTPGCRSPTWRSPPMPWAGTRSAAFRTGRTTSPCARRRPSSTGTRSIPASPACMAAPTTGPRR